MGICNGSGSQRCQTWQDVECPDFYEVDGKHVLVVSPMAMLPEDLKFHVGHSVIYLTEPTTKKPMNL